MPYKDKEKRRKYHSEYNRRWRAENPEKAAAYDRKWKSENRDRVNELQRKRLKNLSAEQKATRDRACKKYRLTRTQEQRDRLRDARREYQRLWGVANRDKRRKAKRRYRERWGNDLQYKLDNRIRCRFRCAFRKFILKGGEGNCKRKPVSAIRDLGCTLAELKTWLEDQFREGMTWENWGPVWHIDHKRPLSTFDLTVRSSAIKAVHYTNLQPLFASENLSKGGTNRRAFAHLRPIAHKEST